MRCAIVIPARMGSSRFPGKPLVDLMGKPMVQWVVEAAQAAEVADRVIVATPDAEIYDACRAFGAEAAITRADHPSGTDRIAEVAERLDADVYVNVQGDEPLLPAATIRALAAPMIEGTYPVGSVFAPCPKEETDNPAVVKVVMRLDGSALYFSRHAIPYPRGDRRLFKHIGLYAYRRAALEAFVKVEPTPLERAESLEQLRFLEMGYAIQMFEGSGSALAVDTPEQAEEVRRILAAR
jgi:3-deoxy-manno-octulosonate cytidylyltransferase (CMP-KDO synthetase)